MIDFTPLPSDPKHLPTGIGRLLLTGDPVRAIALIIRENNRRAIDAQDTTPAQIELEKAG